MSEIIAYCGLLCNECPAYLATQADDDEMREEVASRWSEEHGFHFTKDDINCDGCLRTDGRKIGYCGKCSIRSCAVEKSVENCAHCSEYACERLEDFTSDLPSARSLLDSIRDSLHR